MPRVLSFDIVYYFIIVCNIAITSAIDLSKVNGSFVCKLFVGKENTLFKINKQEKKKKAGIFKTCRCE